MRFPYYQLGPTNFAPIITLQLFGKHGWLDLEAYIDSGASLSIFSADRAKILGIKYTRGQVMHLTVGDGGLLAVYLQKLPVKIGAKRFEAVIGFSDHLGVGFNLLGRKSFFERFRICFNDKDRFVELHTIK